MKKGLVTLAVILALVMSMAIMAPAFAAEANDFDCLIVSPKSADVNVGWGGGTSIGATFEQLHWSGSPTVAEDGSAKFVGAGPAGAYLYIYPSNEKYNHATTETYPYICASVKITGIGDRESFYFVFGEGSTSDMPIEEDLTEYTKIIGELPEGFGLDITILPGDVIQSNASRRLMKAADYGAGGTLQGVTVYIEYVGFFKTEADAQAFDYAAWVEANLNNDPGTSEPETSEPETSEPETSEPETSEPETSEPETSEPEASTSEPEASTSEPEASTSEPEASTSEPEASTSEPEASTSEPESQTSKPQSSTPEKDDEKGGNALIYILIAAAVVIVVVVAVVVKKGKK